jgi:CRISPR system Cascade subunit CasC
MKKFITIEMLNNTVNANLNRDDLGNVKTAEIGGTNRIRISSQCLKRNIRLAAQQQELLRATAPMRSREIPSVLSKKLIASGVSEKDAAKAIEKIFKKLDKKTGNLSTLVFLSQSEIDFIYEGLLKITQGEELKAKDYLSLLKDGVARYGFLISIFGRMFADDPAMNVEASALFTHAYSTHEAHADEDYFTSVDDAGGTQGSGHIGGAS